MDDANSRKFTGERDIRQKKWQYKKQLKSIRPLYRALVVYHCCCRLLYFNCGVSSAKTCLNFDLLSLRLAISFYSREYIHNQCVHRWENKYFYSKSSSLSHFFIIKSISSRIERSKFVCSICCGLSPAPPKRLKIEDWRETSARCVHCAKGEIKQMTALDAQHYPHCFRWSHTFRSAFYCLFYRNSNFEVWHSALSLSLFTFTGNKSLQSKFRCSWVGHIHGTLLRQR